MTDKGISSSNTVLIENGVIISYPKDVFKFLTRIFSSIAESIGKPDNIKDNESIESMERVVRIAQCFHFIDTFEFSTVSEVQVEKQIKSLYPKKTLDMEIPPGIIKLCHKELTLL